MRYRPPATLLLLPLRLETTFAVAGCRRPRGCPQRPPLTLVIGLPLCASLSALQREGSFFSAFTDTPFRPASSQLSAAYYGRQHLLDSLLVAAQLWARGLQFLLLLPALRTWGRTLLQCEGPYEHTSRSAWTVSSVSDWGPLRSLLSLLHLS